MADSPRASGSSSALGLCGACTHARSVQSAKGSTFLRCRMHDVDARFRKYPPLPVTACPGFLPAHPPSEESRP